MPELPQGRTDPGEQGSAKSPISAIGSLVTESIPSLRPEHRALVVVSGVLALLLLGVLLLSQDSATAKWATAGTLVLFALNSVLVFLLSSSRQRGKQEGDYDRRRRAADSVNGPWWQLILVKSDDGDIVAEGLTVVNIKLRVDVGSYGVDGELFDEHGKSQAQWRAEAVAIKSLAPVELFYRFSGYSFRGPVLKDPTGPVTGIGVFAFEDGDGKLPSSQGSGWYATGDVETLRFGKRRDVRLVRVTDSERERLEETGDTGRSDSREQLIQDRYRLLGTRYGAVLGKTWD